MGKYTKEQRRDYQKDYRKRLRILCEEVFQACCANCGSKSSLEFDHVDRTTKVDSISNLIANGKSRELNIELSKCQLLCKSCHINKTREESKKHLDHGSSLYRKGCRCYICSESRREYVKTWRIKKRHSIQVAKEAVCNTVTSETS